MLAFILITLGIVSRVIFHPPNFTPILAIALFSGTYLNKKPALFVAVVFLLISDFILGWHETMVFTWGSILLTVFLGRLVKEHKGISVALGTSIVSAAIFFFVTNFGVWVASGLYPLTGDGLVQCFMMAVPFFRNTFVSTLLYTGVLFSVYELIARRVKDTRLAAVLLSA